MDQDIPFERIGGYRILRRLATGGTSDVLLARAEGPHGFERTVVLKLLLQQFRRDAPMEKMFAREAAAYARLSHPAIVKLYDFFSAEGQLVMVLEYIDGLPLNRFRAMLRKNGEQVDDRASIFVASRVFAALAAAHGARDPESGEFAPVIHRDVNPSNILIPWDGHVKLADFGIAKVAGVTSDTQAGFIKGTYGYMAPEQVRGEPITVRTDVYAASLLLWELLARRKAIQRGALPEIEVLRAMAEPSLPSLDVLRPDLPQRLRESISRGLEPAPDLRSVTAEEMLIVLRDSVTSNEGRNVLAETLARVRQEAEAARSGAPPGVAAEPTPRPSQGPPRPPAPHAPSEASIDGRARIAPGTGQVSAVGGGALGSTLAMNDAPPLTSGGPVARAAAAPQRHVATMAFGTPPARDGERTNTLGSVAHAPPPPAPKAELPRPILGSTTVAMAAFPLGPLAASEPGSPGKSPFHRPMFPPTAEEAPSTVPMPGSGRPPSGPPPAPPPALFTPAALPPAAMTPGELLASTLAAAHLSQPTPLPPPAQPPAAIPPAPPFASYSQSSASSSPPAPLPITRSGMPPPVEAGKTGTYVLLGGLALMASAAFVAVLLWVQKPPGPATGKTAPAASHASAAAASAAPAETPSVSPTTASPPPAATPAPTATSAPAQVASTPPPTPTAAAAPTTETTDTSTDGEIVTPAKARGHRIFVDGHYAGDSPGPIRVRCGTHSLKVGSGGVTHTVNVPCGGQVTVGQR